MRLSGKSLSSLHVRPRCQTVVDSCQINEYGTSILFCLKRILDALRVQGDLIFIGVSTSISRLFLGERWVDEGLDAGIDKSLKVLIENTKQRDRTIAFWSFAGFEGFGIRPLALFSRP